MKKIAVWLCLGLPFTQLVAQQPDTVTIQTKVAPVMVDTMLPPQVISIRDVNFKADSYESPYKLNWKADVPIIVGGLALTTLGVKLIDEKPNLTPQQLAARTPDRVPFFDRHSAGWYSEKADQDSYIPFQASFAMPILAGLIDKRQRHNYLQVMTLYLETMAITGAMFTMTAGSLDRPRPFVYGTKVPDDYRMSGNNQRSFYAGHTASTAAATFFAAKIYNDFHPNSPARTYVWIAAAAVPAVVGYLRYRAGMHFLSDNLLGYGIGAATGILVPHFHKKKINNLSIIPHGGLRYQGLSLVYNVK